MIGVCALNTEDGGVLYVDWLVVKKEFRGHGIGILLLKEVDKWAPENKYHYLYLHTQHEKNIKFYEKRGFKFIGTFEKAWFGETDHILGKQLRKEPFPEAFKVK